jgi:hypothetical protein
MRIVSRLLAVLAVLGFTLVAGLARPDPAAADAIVNGLRIVGSGVPPGVVPGEPVEPVRPTNLVFIDFDDAPQPCSFLETTALRDAYLALGVSFSGPAALDGGAILDLCGYFGVNGYSAPNFVAFNGAAPMLDGGLPAGPERMTFTSEVTTISVGVASPFTGGRAVLRAYDAAFTSIAIRSVSVTSVMKTLSVAAPGIRYADLTFVHPSENVWVFDNLAFDTTPTAAARPTWGRIKTLYR